MPTTLNINAARVRADWYAACVLVLLRVLTFAERIDEDTRRVEVPFVLRHRQPQLK